MASRFGTIIKEGRRLFPPHDYGYGGILNMDGAVIRRLTFGKATNLFLSTTEARKFENGRFYPGFDCYESSWWIMHKLEEQGIPGEYVELQRPPIFDNDIAVRADGTILAITPGIKGFPAGIKYTGEVDVADIELEIRHRYEINFQIQGTRIPLNCERFAGCTVFNFFGIYSVDVLFAASFATYLDGNGPNPRTFETTLSFDKRYLGDARTAAKERDFTWLKRNLSKRSTFSGRLSQMPQDQYAAHNTFAQNTLLRILTILDPACAGRF